MKLSIVHDILFVKRDEHVSWPTYSVHYESQQENVLNWAGYETRLIFTNQR